MLAAKAMAWAVLRFLDGRCEDELGEDKDPVRLRPVLCAWSKLGLVCDLSTVAVTVLRLEDEGDGEDACAEWTLVPLLDDAGAVS